MAPSNDDEINLGKGSKSETENDRKISGAEEGKPRQRRTDNNHINGNRSQQQPKRRRLSNKPHSRCIIPEARVIQGYDEYAYISEHEEDESEREYLPRSTRRRVEVQVSSRNEIPQPQEEAKNDDSFLFKFKAANKDALRHGARCFCFNCW